MPATTKRIRRRAAGYFDMKKLTEECKAEILEDLNTGLPVKDIASRNGCAVPTVYKIAEENGHQFKRFHKYDKYLPEIKEKLSAGSSYAEIGRSLGINRWTVKNICEANGIDYDANEKRSQEIMQNVLETIRERAPEFEYIGGYKGTHEQVTLRCKCCGNIQTVYYPMVRKRRVSCKACKERAEQERFVNESERKRQYAEQIAMAKRLRKEIDALKKRAERMHLCPVCGTITERPKYCCSACANRVANKKRELRRTKKIRKAVIDADITVDALFQRDGGICYLCGKQCRTDDYEVRNGTIVTGNLYPSIDHIKPLSKGGLHSWQNVRLAHRICNSIKSDSMPPASKTTI